MKIRPIFAIFAITAILADFAVRAEVGSADKDKSTTRFCQDDKSREKYCQSANPDDIERCLSCYVGPSCPVPGSRSSVGETNEGMFLLRGITDRKIQKLIVAMLNKQRLSQQWSRCVPLFSWDPALASAAQAWADQCALVEYIGTMTHENQSQIGDPEKLHHDSWRQRSTVLEASDGNFHNEPGVAQTVHWARTPGFDINGKILEALIESHVQTEDGLVDGLMTNLAFSESDSGSSTNSNKNLVVFGQATHVGCGWIQFPTSTSTKDSKDQAMYENFMVCNYGVGVASKTTCDELTNKKAVKNETETTVIKYYTVTSEVIKDVKACLEAVRCRRRRRKFLRTFTTDTEDRNDPCGNDVRRCLSGRSGHRFLDATKLRSVARSNEFMPIDMEATKCKIDTILCSLNTTSTCKDRMEYCLPLMDFKGQDFEGQVLCECANLILADGTHGDCSQKIEENNFCFVKQSPCVSITPEGQLELSKPYPDIQDGLIHYTHLMC